MAVQPGEGEDVMTKIAKKRGGGFREATPEEVKARGVKGGNLVSLSGAKGGVEVLTTDETEANKVHLRLLDLKVRYEDTYFEIAHMLYRVSEERLFTAKSLGAHESFRDYVEGELKMSIRKAQNLVGIHWWYFVKQKSEPKLLQGAREIGWTKAHLLVKVVDSSNADKWFELAKSVPKEELRQHVRAALKAAGRKQDRRVKDTKPRMNPPPGMKPEDPEPETPTTEEAEANGQVVENDPAEAEGVSLPTEEQVEEVKAKDQEWTIFSMKVPVETKPIILEAVELAKKLAKTHQEGYALSLMAQHFLSFSHDKKTVMIGEWLAAFERNTGLHVIAVDPEDEKVIYGHDYLKAISDEEE
jgi:hypothetical protein